MSAANNLVARLTTIMGSAAPAALTFLEQQYPDPVERLAQLEVAVDQAEALTSKRR